MRPPVRRPRHPFGHGALALLLLIVAAAAGRFVGSLGLDSPWIAPDEMTYGILGRAFWTTGHMRLLDGSSASYGLYPVVIGLPLTLFGTATGVAVVKGLEAILLASTALIAFLWARPLVGPRWALAAAALTVALPGFAYSGLLMKETVSIPAVTLALWLLARALARPSLANQALLGAAVVLAVALRFQSAILLPTTVVALVLCAWFCRDRGVVRRFAPTLAALGAVAVLGLLVARVGSRWALLAQSDFFAHAGYSPGPALRWIAYHAADVFLLVLGVPLIATLILVVEAARGRVRDPRVGALLAVVVAYTALAVVQIGLFSSRWLDQLDERTLISTAPPIFVAFVVWLEAGLPRPQPVSGVVALVAVVPALFLPVKTVVNTYAVPSAFMIAPLLSLLERTSADTLQLTWLLGVAAVLLVTLFVPRRAAPLLAVLIVVALAAASALVQTRIDRRAQFDRRLFFGSASPQWIDRAADGSVVYLDDGDPLWNADWHVAFWNERVRALATLARSDVALPGAIPVSARRPDGRLVRADGSPLTERLVVTRRWVTLVGTPLAHIAQGAGEPGSTLWRTPSAPIVSTWTRGIAGRSDLEGPATVTVFDCRAGRLELTLTAKQGLRTVAVSAGKLAPASLSLSPNSALEGWVPAPPYRGARRTCVFRLAPDGPVELGRLAFRRGSNADVAAASRRESGGTTTFVETGSKPLGPRENMGYCVGGVFQERPSGRYPDATPAIFVTGAGLTCDGPPTGYVDKGFAPAALGVPENTYRLYGPP